eukprot:2361377-Rhodomonas_salina.1
MATKSNASRRETTTRSGSSFWRNPRKSTVSLSVKVVPLSPRPLHESTIPSPPPLPVEGTVSVQEGAASDTESD